VRWYVDGRLRIDGRLVRLADPEPGETRLLWGAAR
jgi:hypothetical protein